MNIRLYKSSTPKIKYRNGRAKKRTVYFFISFLMLIPALVSIGIKYTSGIKFPVLISFSAEIIEFR